MRNVLVTGGSRGIGLAIARRLAASGGYDVIALARHQSEGLAAAVREAQRRLHFRACDPAGRPGNENGPDRWGAGQERIRAAALNMPKPSGTPLRGALEPFALNRDELLTAGNANDPDPQVSNRTRSDR